MKHNVLALLLCLSLISACGPSPEAIASQTATAATAIAVSWTKTPTPTITPTSTPTATFTPSPIPTPIGGGRGRLMFFRDSALYSFDITNQNAEVVITQQQLMEVLRLRTVFRVGIFGNISPDGKKALIQACGDENCTESKFKIALVTTDLSAIKRFNLGYLYTIEWSLDSQKLLLQTDPGGTNLNIIGYVTQVIDSGETNFGKLTNLDKAFSASFSPDGMQIYYSTRNGYKVVNSDGSGELALNCEICSNFSPNTIAISPNGLKVAVSSRIILSPTKVDTASNIVITDQSFSTSHVLVSNISGFPQIRWSPDSKNLLILSTYPSPKLEIIKIDSEIITTLDVPKEAINAFLCGWSPDSGLISYFAVFSYDPFQYSIFLQDVEGGEPTRLTPFESGVEFCPVWLPSK